jgi:hypothetical protein
MGIRIQAIPWRLGNDNLDPAAETSAVDPFEAVFECAD